MTPQDLTRSFPFTVRPHHLETLDSYTRRTLAVNGEHDRLPRELLTFAQKTNPGMSWQTILAAKVRRDLGQLTAPRGKHVHAQSAPPAALLGERWACILCTRGEHVQQHPHLDDFLCERHHRWTGPRTAVTAQPTVTPAQVTAHQKLRTLRRKGRLNTRLLLETLETLVFDLDSERHDVFDLAVAITSWVTRKDTLRRLFDPAQPFAETFAWMRASLVSVVGRATPATLRTVWLHLWPAHVALQSAFRGYTGYRSADAHEFTLPTDIVQWFPHPETLQSQREYMACTGDDQAAGLSSHGDSHSVCDPKTRQTYCDKGHRYLEVITSDSIEDCDRTPCPECIGFHVQPGVNDLASVAPHIAEELHPTLNGDLLANGIAARSHRRVWWVCSKEGHPFRAAPMNRTLVDSGCSVCLGRVVLRGVNDFATTHPQLALQLVPSDRYGKRAHQLTANDTKMRDWVCTKGHPFRTTVKKRVTTRGGCAECQKLRRRSSGRNLTATHPAIARTWRPELNEGRLPEDYTKGSAVDVIWWCEKGDHPFEMRIEARTRGCGCPYCAHRLILPGFNDFATIHPELAVDWHPYLNRKYASEVMPGSNDKHHWRCENGHVLHRSIPHRIAAGGCVECPRQERAGNRIRSAQATSVD